MAPNITEERHGQSIINHASAHMLQPQEKPACVENFRSLRVIVIGAGFSGIYCAIRIPQRLRGVELTVYEKNAGVGGTWWENRYPGAACDIPGNSSKLNLKTSSKLRET